MRLTRRSSIGRSVPPPERRDPAVRSFWTDTTNTPNTLENAKCPSSKQRFCKPYEIPSSGPGCKYDKNDSPESSDRSTEEAGVAPVQFAEAKSVEANADNSQECSCKPYALFSSCPKCKGSKPTADNPDEAGTVETVISSPRKEPALVRIDSGTVGAPMGAKGGLPEQQKKPGKVSTPVKERTTSRTLLASWSELEQRSGRRKSPRKIEIPSVSPAAFIERLKIFGGVAAPPFSDESVGDTASMTTCSRID